MPIETTKRWMSKRMDTWLKRYKLYICTPALLVPYPGHPIFMGHDEMTIHCQGRRVYRYQKTWHSERINLPICPLHRVALTCHCRVIEEGWFPEKDCPLIWRNLSWLLQPMGPNKRDPKRYASQEYCPLRAELSAFVPEHKYTNLQFLGYIKDMQKRTWTVVFMIYVGIEGAVDNHQTIFEKLPRKDIRIAGSGYLNSLNFLPYVHLRYPVTYFSAYSPWGLWSYCKQPGHLKDNCLHFPKRKEFFFKKEDANKSYLNWNRSAPSISDHVYMVFEHSCEESSHKLVCN
jgi:hypothetical protein